MKRVLAVSALAVSLQACSDAIAPVIPQLDLPAMPLASVAAPTGPSVWTVDAGSNFTCAVAYTGAAFCWGTNGNGQMGNGGTASSSVPVAVAGGLSFAQVSAGTFNACGVTTDGTAYCWGYNGGGRNGNGTGGGNSLSPTAVAGDLRFRSVSVGADHACGVATDNRAYCWGTNGNGRTGNGVSTGVSFSPVAVAGDLLFASISAGNLHTCAVALDGTGYCWGENAGGQLGDGTTGMHATPVAVAGNHTFTSISAGGSHSCGVTSDAGTLCWGTGLFGQLGTGVMNDVRLTPTALQNAAPGMTLASAGSDYSCAATDTAAYCWGLNSSGQLGTGNTTNSAQPVAVRLASPVVLVSAGTTHSCGVVPSESAVYCWGFNASGQLGNGTTVSSPVPVRVALATTTIDMSIDIAPSDATNTVSRGGHDPLEVALLGSGGFDPSTVDPSTVLFAGATPAGATVQDVNADGFPDLVAQFAVPDLTLPEGTSQACANGRTLGGVPFTGCGQITLITNQAPTAVAGGPYEIVVREAAALDASASSDPDGDTLTYDWAFGDGGVAANGGAHVSHVYTTAGTFSATVTVSDGKGGSSVAGATLTVLSAADAAAALKTMVDRLISDAGRWRHWWTWPLTASVRVAVASLRGGHTHIARWQLREFIEQVKAARRAHRMSADTAQALIAYARRVLHALGD